MRIILFFTLMVFGVGAVQAQETAKVEPHVKTRTELGIFGHINFDDHADRMDMVGLQFKKVVNDRRSLRVIAGYGSYDGPQLIFERSTSGDTVVDRFTETNIHVGIIGAGVEMQRHFYKRVYLFAALEVRGGYGNGSHDTLVRKIDRSGSPYTYGTREGRAGASMVYASVMPSIGAKLQFKKISFGTELTGVDASFRHRRVEGRSGYGLTDVQMGKFSQRVFVNYRF